SSRSATRSPRLGLCIQAHGLVYTRPTSLAGRSPPPVLLLLAGVHEALRVERVLHGPVQLEQTRCPLPRERAALDQAGAVLPRDRAAQLDGQREQVLRSRVRTRELALVGRVEHERRVEVPVTRVAPAACGEPVAPADLECLLDGLPEPVERDDDVL